MLDALDAAAVRRWCVVGLEALQRTRGEIDRLNVYPVADRDTGTNLVLTMQSVAEALRATDGPVSLGATVKAMSQGAVTGARGNSGVILSGFLRGFAESLRTGTATGGLALVHALERAADVCYGAVAHPVEGTVLTVARSAAQAAKATRSADLATVARAAAAGAHRALSRTPSQLSALATAGVVDAGGRGLCVLLDALVGVVTGEPPTLDGSAAAIGDENGRKRTTEPISTPAGPLRGEPEHPSVHDDRPSDRPPEPAAEHDATRLHSDGEHAAGHDDRLADGHEQAGDRYAYEVQYLLEPADASMSALQESLSALGDSVAVDGSDGVWAVHAHVNDVGAAVEAGLQAGRPYRIAVSRLSGDSGTPRGRRSVVALAPPGPLAALFQASGALVLPMDPVHVPSPERLLAVIRDSEAAEVAVLPNGTDAHASADEAARMARDVGITVAVIPTRSIVQGLSALGVSHPECDFADDVIAMSSAAAGTRWAEITIAAERAQTSAGMCERGDVLGLVEDDVALIGTEAAAVAVELLDRMLAGGGELVTLLTGAQASDLADRLRTHVRAAHPVVELVAYAGEKPGSLALIGVE